MTNRAVIILSFLLVLWALPSVWSQTGPSGGGSATPTGPCGGDLNGTFPNCGVAKINGSTPAAVATSGSAADLSAGTLAAARGGAGTINGALKANGSGTVTQAACADLSNSVTSCSTDATNASNIASGTLAAARGGAGTINGALKANGSGVVTQAACADLSNSVASCSTDATNAANISSGVLAAARGGAGTISGLLKANGSGTVSQAASGTDYIAPGAAGSFTTVTHTDVEIVAGCMDFQVPSSGNTINIASGICEEMVAPAGTLTTLTVNLISAPVNGQKLKVRFTQIITTLTLGGGGSNSIVGNPVSAALGVVVDCVYRTSNTTWYC